ncbi:hypothetical protein EX30DRAFT_10576 [Ascodesmis nigricans]|uniref:Uncharacterized protein n=1 Tax=Ascodesmis nigricans TaxID=341454 RepID=A0A4V3SJQ1_9PEZI|nr:hypothetical protein EX30DRAFT_10576 [Ascodesmis nigricans]
MLMGMFGGKYLHDIRLHMSSQQHLQLLLLPYLLHRAPIHNHRPSPDFLSPHPPLKPLIIIRIPCSLHNLHKWRDPLPLPPIAGNLTFRQHHLVAHHPVFLARQHVGNVVQNCCLWDCVEARFDVELDKVEGLLVETMGAERGAEGFEAGVEGVGGEH